MMNFLSKKLSDHESSATVVDGNLIISLPNAIDPVVWRMELGSVKASAMEVKADEAAKRYVLSLKTPKGDVHPVAPFATRDAAVEALMRVATALQNAEGKMVAANQSINFSQAPSTPRKASTGVWKWLAALAGIILVIALFSYLSSITPISDSAAPVSEGPSSGDAGDSGVPQSADQLLQGF